MAPILPDAPVVLITGCSSGIGENLALAFAARRFTVIATARRVESLAHLTRAHDNIIALALELGDLGSFELFRDDVAKRTEGRLDILINNAGTHYASTALDLEVAEAEKLFAINVFAVMRLGSVTRDVPVAWQCVYNASKAALSQYTKTLRLEVQPFGVEVIEVVTGFVRSNILRHGLLAPKDSPYLPIKKEMERIKNEGNQNGMAPDKYAESVVNKLLREGTSAEIWEGKLAWQLYLIVSFLPLWLQNWLFSRSFKLNSLGRPAK